MDNLQQDRAKIAINIRAHDRVANRYERTHGEIYNPVEQSRLLAALRIALAAVKTSGERNRVLDFGCGAGNLTAHLTSLGCDVLASDVSQACIDLVLSKPYSTSVEGMQLNGSDLSNLPDSSVDMVATYSVLHHVPDYLGILSEFVRVLKPGGVVFIDHELTAEVWRQSSERSTFLAELSASMRRDYLKYLRPSNYVNWFILKFVNARYRPEGDIHVFIDDHIEWPKIVHRLEASGMEVVLNEKYLLFKRGYDPSVHEKYVGRTNDMELLVARKK